LIKIRTFDKKVKKIIEEDTLAFLHAAGQIAVNNWVSLSPYLTGVYRNSIVYNIDGDLSPYGNNEGESGKGRVSTPLNQRTVRIGLNLVYANSIEKKYHTGVRSMDKTARSINRELSKFFDLRGL
jgi:hypothetical protein